MQPAERILKKQLASMPTFILGDFQTKKCTKKDIGQNLRFKRIIRFTGTGIISLEHFLKLLLKNQ
jgi:hypothetical protein